MKTIEERNKTIYKTDNDIFLAVSNDVHKNRIVDFEMENIKKVSNDEKIELIYYIYFESAKKGLTPIFKNIDELNLEFKQNAKYVKDVNPIKFDGKDYRTVVIRYPLDENTTITEVEEYYRKIIKNLSRQDQVKHSL